VQLSSANPFENLNCIIFLKGQMLFQGKLTAGGMIETRILKWQREGIIIENEWRRNGELVAKTSFIPWSSIASVSPLEMAEELPAHD
jgi:hypothetical protein